MVFLKNDYCGICHEKILENIQRYKQEKFVGYGLDKVTKKVEEKIKNLINNPDAKVYFTTGGTSTNKIVISHLLRPYEAVITCDSGHINVHETGAIEASGHKVLVVPNEDGKITAKSIRNLVSKHNDFHMVKPRMVYISNPTEYGTIYTKSELLEIKKVCVENDLYFYIDGARLGCALVAPTCDYNIAEFASIADIFYIGGTKNGLMFGEALIVCNKYINNNIRYSIKNNGGLLAKCFIVAIQFEELLNNNLLYEIAKKENESARLLEEGLKKLNVPFLINRQTNQLFPIFDKQTVKLLENEISFDIWEQQSNNIVIRLVTNFLTTDDDIQNAIAIIKKILDNTSK